MDTTIAALASCEVRAVIRFLHAEGQRATGDSTWVKFVNAEAKEQSKQWMHTHSPNKPKKFNLLKPTGYVMHQQVLRSTTEFVLCAVANSQKVMSVG